MVVYSLYGLSLIIKKKALPQKAELFKKRHFLSI